MSKRNGIRLAAALGLAMTLLSIFEAGTAAQDRKSIQPKDRENPLNKLISGYYFTSLEIRSLQDDDFDNPGFRWVQQGEALWAKTEGGAQKACSSCHGSASDAMRGKAATYPKFEGGTGQLINFEQRINKCREEKMQASPWAYGAEELLAMTAYLRMQSRGIPVNVRIDGLAKPDFNAGKQLYNSRIGQLGMSCALCHNRHYGQSLRGVLISQGHSNGFPTYQAEAKKFVSLHGRFDACFTLMRAEPFAAGSSDYIALELYLAWRGNGLPIETPAVRP
jgi:L-cysteine S-thiosulfotransferase